MGEGRGDEGAKKPTDPMVRVFVVYFIAIVIVPNQTPRMRLFLILPPALVPVPEPEPEPLRSSLREIDSSRGPYSFSCLPSTFPAPAQLSMRMVKEVFWPPVQPDAAAKEGAAPAAAETLPPPSPPMDAPALPQEL